MNSIIQEEFQNHIITSQKSLENLSNEIEIAAKICIETLKKNGKIILFGNGGSAADAQHIAAEFIGRFNINRESLPAIALTSNSSTITALANDFSFDTIFKSFFSVIKVGTFSLVS